MNQKVAKFTKEAKKHAVRLGWVFGEWCVDNKCYDFTAEESFYEFARRHDIKEIDRLLDEICDNFNELVGREMLEEEKLQFKLSIKIGKAAMKAAKATKGIKKDGV